MHLGNACCFLKIGKGKSILWARVPVASSLQQCVIVPEQMQWCWRELWLLLLLSPSFWKIPVLCVGLGRDTVHTPQGEQLPPKSRLAMIYTQAHRLGNCSKQNKQTSLWIYGLAKGPLTTKEMCFAALFYRQIPTKGLNAYVKPTELRIWAGFKLFLHLPCCLDKSSHSSPPVQLPADTHTHVVPEGAGTGFFSLVPKISNSLMHKQAKVCKCSAKGSLSSGASHPSPVK